MTYSIRIGSHKLFVEIQGGLEESAARHKVLS